MGWKPEMLKLSAKEKGPWTVCPCGEDTANLNHFPCSPTKQANRRKVLWKEICVWRLQFPEYNSLPCSSCLGPMRWDYCCKAHVRHVIRSCLPHGPLGSQLTFACRAAHPGCSYRGRDITWKLGSTEAITSTLLGIYRVGRWTVRSWGMLWEGGQALGQVLHGSSHSTELQEFKKYLDNAFIHMVWFLGGPI